MGKEWMKRTLRSSLAFQLYEVYTAPTEVEDLEAQEIAQENREHASLARQVSQEWNNFFSSHRAVGYTH